MWKSAHKLGAPTARQLPAAHPAHPSILTSVGRTSCCRCSRLRRLQLAQQRPDALLQRRNALLQRRNALRLLRRLRLAPRQLAAPLVQQPLQLRNLGISLPQQAAQRGCAPCPLLTAGASRQWAG